MSMTSSDIRNYKFPTVLRGYDKDAVDAFLEQIAQTVDLTKQESMRVSMEMESIKGQLLALKQFEDTIKNAAIDSRRNADMLIATARQEAAQILAKAKSESDQAVASRSNRVHEADAQLKQLEATRTQYLNKLRSLISQHLDMVNQVSSSEIRDQKAEEKIEVIGSTDMSRRKSETIANKTTRPAVERTEEANAPSRIVAKAVDEPAQFASEMKAALQSDQPAATRLATTQQQATSERQAAPEQQAAHEQQAVPAAQQIDPELAAALERYQKLAKEKGAAHAIEQTMMNRTSHSGTSAIPTGYVASQQAAAGEDATDRMTTHKKSAVIPDEHNSINIDTPIMSERPMSGTTGLNLARELDEVVARFEEEMDKAAKTNG